MHSSLSVSTSIKFMPDLRRSVDILQMSSIELCSFVDAELLVNPILSMEGDDDHGFNRIISSCGSEYIDNIASRETITEYLTKQVHICTNNDAEYLIAQDLIALLNDHGIIEQDIGVMSSEHDMRDVEMVLHKLQNFCDPVGVFARSVQESLTLQLDRQDMLTDNMIKLVANIELLSQYKLKELQKVCNIIKEEELLGMIAIFKSLNVNPLINFSDENICPIIPDVIVNQSDTGLVTELSPHVMPKISIDYSIKNQVVSSADMKFVRDKIKDGKNLLYQIMRRASTIQKIAKLIVEYQNDFLLSGSEIDIKPLKLKDISEKIGMHESTVSRVVNSKYISTSYGVFPMKFFFSGSVGNIHAISEKKIKNIMKDIIDNEQNSLSDNDIVLLLQSKNIKIARRTVVKYRESMNIPNSRIRKSKQEISKQAYHSLA